ncbi:MarR family transcriptional regulator [Sedimentitalea sp. JM2-8]|uniref:MarR family transcriptional regulator n=1 Tax=Sedimentitalea xiamensis TaxID=3050037 RepID=A0ABT7FA25_9RHOB|nr:MarR family transcriptional regulator [Sedimentitalea xiamensis]MDK3071946.1 MarR family transcriptional regulator [Sedimentitalea xiamensis]
MRLETYFPYRLAIAAEAFSQKLVEVYGREYGLSREEWRLLALLADEKEVTSADLKRRATLDKVQISRASKRLEEKDLVVGRIAEHDKRQRIYRCTDAGRALFAELFPRVEARAEAILNDLSEPDRLALLRGIAALTEAVGGKEPNGSA